MLFCVNTFYSQFDVREGEKLQTMNLGFRQGRCLTPDRLIVTRKSENNFQFYLCSILESNSDTNSKVNVYLFNITVLREYSIVKFTDNQGNNYRAL
jgi:hypothetical protein